MQKIIRLQLPEVTKSIDTLSGYLKVLYHTDQVKLVSLKKIKAYKIDRRNGVYKSTFFINHKKHVYYLKFYFRVDDPDIAQKEFSILSQIHDKDTHTVVKPIISINNFRCLVTEEFKGYKVKDLIRAYSIFGSPPRGMKALHAIIIAYAKTMIRYLSITTNHNEAILDRMTLEQEVLEKLKFLHDEGIIDNRERKNLLRRFDERQVDIHKKKFPRCANNADIGIENALTDYSNVVLHDFEDITYGTACHDFVIGYLSLRYLTLNPLVKKKIIFELEDLFMREIINSELYDASLFNFFTMIHTLRHIFWTYKIRKSPIKRSVRDIFLYRLRMNYYRRLLLSDL